MPTAKLDTPVQYLKGVGPKLAKKFNKLDVRTIEDLIYYFPRDYEDRSVATPIGELEPGTNVIIKGEVARINHQMTRNRFSVLKIILTDLSGSIQAVWFNQTYLATMFRQGMKLIVSGKAEFSEYEGALQFTVKDFEIDTGVNPKIVPLYPLTEGIYPKKLRSLAIKALEDHLSEINEWMPEELLKKHKLIGLNKAIRSLHLPEKIAEIEPARRRLVFDDFFLFQLGLGLRKKSIKASNGIAFKHNETDLAEFKASLQFQFTKAQDRVLADITFDMAKPQPMNRLLQGDVGSGKTIVAASAAFIAIRSEYQVAFMAPTEILAQQHYEKLTKLLNKFKIKSTLLTSSTKKQATTYRLQETDLIIGTHALIQSKVNYKKLGLVIIDEQHRFGVLQRANLVKKGINPDVLVMTATPIPRSLALTLYGDLDRSVIDEMPPGRTPVETHYVPENKRRSAYEFMRQEIKKGRQIFIVCPLVEESEKVDLKAAMDEAEILKSQIFPEFNIGLMHGRLRAEEKDKIMQAFKSGKINILVSTTVIEVGIDVPNATVMVIEHAERFGLSQLHQLRGRIGRGSEQSYCFLIAETKSQDAKTRIKAMLDSTDGFRIAEVDLKLRGPGDFCGTRQSGLPNFRVADIIKDEKILREARQAAFDLIAANGESARYIWKSQGQTAQGAAARAALN